MTSTILPSPKDLGLYYDEWRDGQWDAIESISTDPAPIIIREAPTGTGKTGIAIGAARHNLWKTFALTMTHSLQDQYVAEGNGRVMKVIGRRNYECILPAYDPHEARERGAKEGTTVDQAPCAGGFDCPIKPSCNYFVHKGRAMDERITAHNYQYWLPEATFSKGFTGADLLVCDEGHLLDSVLCDFSSIKLTAGRLAQLKSFGITLPPSENVEDWREVGLRGADASSQVLRDTPHGTVERARWETTKRLYEGLGQINNIGGDSWVVDRTQYETVVRPVWPLNIKDILLGDKAKRALIMSATILDIKMFAEVLGLDVADYSFEQLPFVFPPESRPVYYRPAATVTQETFQKAAAMLGAASSSIMGQRKGENGVIHTQSYALQEAVLPHIKDKDRLIIQERGVNRTDIINEYKAGSSDKWLVSPSVTHGEDFKLASVQIMLKMPFPSMRDKVVRIRMKQSQAWYKWVTAQNVEQTIGRVTRSLTDYGETYILDSKFESIIPYLHKEVREAIR